MYILKMGLTKKTFAAHQRKAVVLSTTASIAILISQVAGSSDLQRGMKQLSEPESALPTIQSRATPVLTTVVTHHHTRIVPSLGSDDFALMSRSAGSLTHAIIAAEVAPARYVKRTYTNTVPAADQKPRTIELFTTTPMFHFKQVGFPHIETSRRRNTSRYKPYQQLIQVKSGVDGVLYGVPNVRCHGYSAEKTETYAARYEHTIRKYTERYNVDYHLVKAVIAQESCFRKHAVSPAGAVGLMQLMPATAKWLGVNDKTNPAQNLKAGIRYLGQLTQRFESNELALAAYNAGPRNVERYDGIPPFKETQDYVRKVIHNYHSYMTASKFNAES